MNKLTILEDKIQDIEKYKNLDEMISSLGEEIVLKYIKVKGTEINNILNEKINSLDFEFLSLKAKFMDCEGGIKNLSDNINIKDIDKINEIENISKIIGNKSVNILSKNEGFISIVKKAFKEIENIEDKINNTSALDFVTIKNRFGASSLENYWLENRLNMFNNFSLTKENSGKINEITQNIGNDSILDPILKTGKLFNIENNKIIIDIDKSLEIFEVVKNVFLNIPPEELIFLGKVIPSTLGSFILYKKISGLYSKMLLKQEENFIKGIKYSGGTVSEIIKNKYLTDLKDLQKSNRISQISFNISSMLMVGILLTGFTTALNKNIEWKIKLGNKDPLSVLNEGENLKKEIQSFIPLFIKNKFKNFKGYFIFIFLGFLIWRVLNIIYPTFFQGLLSKILIFCISTYFYLIFLLICWLVFLILQYLLYLYFLNNKDREAITNNKFIKYLPSIYNTKGLYYTNMEDKIKDFFISHFTKLIFIYMLMIVSLLMVTILLLLI